MAERPVITAHWSNLLLLNFSVPPEAIVPFTPAGTVPDFHAGQAYVSIVGFRFDVARLFGILIPGHTRFPEINLRYYVRRTVGGETRRGVVFVREIVPRRAVALTANWLYHENYITRRMRCEPRTSGPALEVGDIVEYAWRTKVPLPFREACGELSRAGLGEGSSKRANASKHRWNCLAARVAAPFHLPAPGSLDEFFVEHYWGYVRGRDGITREYKVAHEPWRVAAAGDVVWDCDIAATYDTPLAEYLAKPPASTVIATGSAIKLYRGRRL